MQAISRAKLVLQPNVRNYMPTTNLLLVPSWLTSYLPLPFPLLLLLSDNLCKSEKVVYVLPPLGLVLLNIVDAITVAGYSCCCEVFQRYIHVVVVRNSQIMISDFMN